MSYHVLSAEHQVARTVNNNSNIACWLLACSLARKLTNHQHSRTTERTWFESRESWQISHWRGNLLRLHPLLEPRQRVVQITANHDQFHDDGFDATFSQIRLQRRHERVPVIQQQLPQLPQLLHAPRVRVIVARVVQRLHGSHQCRHIEGGYS